MKNIHYNKLKEMNPVRNRDRFVNLQSQNIQQSNQILLVDRSSKIAICF